MDVHADAAARGAPRRLETHRVHVGVTYSIALRFLLACGRSSGFWLGLASGVIGSLLGIMASACYVEGPNPDPSTDDTTGSDTGADSSSCDSADESGSSTE